MKPYFKVILYLLLVAGIVITIQSCVSGNKSRREYYQLTTYHFSTDSQGKIIDDYLQKALLPALHKMEFKNIGVFKNRANDTVIDNKTTYVLLPLNSLDDIVRVSAMLNFDKVYQSLGSDYLGAGHNSPPYVRMETVLLHAFEMAPTLAVPNLKGPRKDRIYELRVMKALLNFISRIK